MGSSYQYQAPQSQPPYATIQQYQQYLPSIINEQAAGVAPMATAEGAAAGNIIPQLNALDLAQLSKYALPEAQIGQEIANSNALAGAQTNVNQLAGPGGTAAGLASSLTDYLSPAYSAAQRGAAEGVGAINLNGLSPGEAAATERSLNQNNVGTGNLGLLNPQNTISNALNFGGAFNSKIGLLNQATGAASGATSSGASLFNPTNVALGQPNTSTLGNFGTSTYSAPNASTGSNALNASVTTAGNFLSGVTGLNNATTGANAQLGSTSMSTGGAGAYLADVCCFIFLEAYYGNIPKAVRHGRDKFYYKNHDIATGYRRTAKILVPLMQRYTFARFLVWYLLVAPITRNLEDIRVVTFDRNVTHFWLRLWAILGKGHKETEYSMTWNYGWIH